MAAPPPRRLPAEFVVDEASAGARVDAYLAARLPEFSRSHLRRAIDAGAVTLDGRPAKPSARVHAGGLVVMGEFAPPHEGPAPEPIALEILYEDDDLIVVDKPPGMVVHPAKGHWAGTLASALAHHFGQLSTAGGAARPGIVHRLDRDTSGVIVVAKHDQAHERLAAQFKARTAGKEYLAVVTGVPDRDEDVIDKPIAPHPHQREKMATREGHETSRPALTRIKVIERFTGFALMRALPKTGRTHQIRVHLAHAGHPVLCDRLYGGRSQITARELGASENAEEVVLQRQALHALRLTIDHPTTGDRRTFEAPVPQDMQRALALLRESP